MLVQHILQTSVSLLYYCCIQGLYAVDCKT